MTTTDQVAAAAPSLLDRATATASAVMNWLSSFTGWKRWALVAVAAAGALYYSGLVPSLSFGSNEPSAIEQELGGINDALASLKSEVQGLRAELRYTQNATEPATAAKSDVDALRKQIMELESAVRTRLRSPPRKSR